MFRLLGPVVYIKTARTEYHDAVQSNILRFILVLGHPKHLAKLFTFW